MKPSFTRSTLLWGVLAFGGLLVAAAVSYAASQLSKPQIGLASEPVSATARLAPQPERKPHRRRRKSTHTTPAAAPAPPRPAATATAPVPPTPRSTAPSPSSP